MDCKIFDEVIFLVLYCNFNLWVGNKYCNEFVLKVI